MRVVEDKKRNFKDFYKIAVGTVFRFNGDIFVKTEAFFSTESIEDYFRHTDIMEDIGDMYDEYDNYNAFCLSSDKYFFSSIGENAEVEVIDIELHIV